MYREPANNRNVTVAPFVPEKRNAFLVGTSSDIGSAAGTLPRGGTMKRSSRVVNEYQPSYGPNESTLRRIAKEKEAEGEKKTASVNPTYIDDEFDDDFDDY